MQDSGHLDMFTLRHPSGMSTELLTTWSRKLGERSRVETEI